MNKIIKCPQCDNSYYVEKYNTTTAVYYPPIYKDGVNVNPDGNITTHYCQVLSSAGAALWFRHKPEYQ